MFGKYKVHNKYVLTHYYESGLHCGWRLRMRPAHLKYRPIHREFKMPDHILKMDQP